MGRKRLLQQFYLLIYIKLNDPQLQKAKKLSDFLPEVDKHLSHNLTLAIADMRGTGVCLLLDGLDEAQPDTLNACFNLMMGSENAKYPQLSFIMTTRPNSQIALQLLSVVKTKICISGFSKSKLHEFLRANLSTYDHKHMEEQLEIIPQLEGLCGLPINAAIMIFLAQFSDQISFSKTQTGLYKQLICNFLVRHMQTRTTESEPNAIETFDDLPLNLQGPFKHLCELAYLAITKKKRLFTIKDLEKAAIKIDNTLGLLRSYQKITISGIQRHYSFHHTSVHDFLAAIHIVQMKESEQVSAIKTISEDALSQVIPFYAGLGKLSNRRVLTELSRVLRKPLDDKNTIDALTKNPSTSNDPRRKALTFFQCLFECQDNSLLQLPETQLVQYEALSGNKEFTDGKFTNSHVVCMTCLNLSPIDCIAIGYFLKVKSLAMKEKSLIYLRMGRCSDIGMASFFKEIRSGIRTYTSTRVLVGLTHSFLSRTTLSALRDALVGPSNIDQLRITRRAEVNSVNVKSKDVVYALKCMVEGLAQNSSCISIVLDGFSTEENNDIHAFYVILMLRACTLRDLHYCNADFHKTMHLISEAVKLSTLKTLVLMRCNIDDKALLQLGHGVCRNPRLIHVTVALNPYTINGVMNFLRLFVNNDISSLFGFCTESSVMTQLRQKGEFYLLLFTINSARSNKGKNPLVPVPFDFMFANLSYSEQIAWNPKDLNTLDNN